MIIGRRLDFIEKIRRSCAAWQRRDATLQIATQGHSIFVTAFDEFLKMADGETSGFHQELEEYPDAVLVDFYEAVSCREGSLKQRILSYYEAHDPRAKAAAARQLKLPF